MIGSLDPAVIAGRGLLAIAEDGNDGGPLCLDTTKGLNPEHWPVVLWDHDERNTTGVLYSSASRLVACGAYLLGGGAPGGLAEVDPAGAAADYYAIRRRGLWPRSVMRCGSHG